MRSRKRPTIPSSLVRLEKVIEPVRWARSWKVAVAVSPGAMSPSSTLASLSRLAPLTAAAGRLTLTALAGVLEVLRTITLAS